MNNDGVLTYREILYVLDSLLDYHEYDKLHVFTPYISYGSVPHRVRKKTRGFKNNARLIARRQGISVKRANAILAAGARNASRSAVRRNPRLKRVKRRKKR